MRGAQRRVFNILVVLTMLGLTLTPLLLLRAPFGDLAFVTMLLATLYVGAKVRRRLHARAMRRRLDPFLEVIEHAGPMDVKQKEKVYQQTLLGTICKELTIELKPESPLRSGTEVDAWIRFDGDDWYVTIKRKLSNQSRLTLQGEIEDILLHAPKGDGDLWIVVLVGVPDLVPPLIVGHLNSLVDYTSSRAASFSAQAKRRVSIKVLPV